jgi:hypothetical protein
MSQAKALVDGIELPPDTDKRRAVVNTVMNFPVLLSPYVLHATPFLFFCILSPQ